MKQVDRHFQSLKRKVNLTEEEKQEMLVKLNEQMAHRQQKRTVRSWKYIATLATTFALVFIISLSIFQQTTHTPTGDLQQVHSPFVADDDEIDSILEVIDHFLPPNSSLASPNRPNGAEAIQFYDLDEDGTEEAIVTYERKGEVEPSPSQFGVFVLQKGADGWQKIWEKQTEGVGLDYFGLVDVTHDGVKELLFGVTIGSSVGNQIEIFKWDQEIFQRIYDMYYHQLEVVNDDRTGLALWDRFLADTYLVQVVSWNGEEFVFDEQLFAKYYPTIEAFYEEKIAYMDAWFYWHALADAQIKANLLEDAKNSIQKGIDLAEEMELTDAVESLQKLKEELEKKEKAS